MNVYELLYLLPSTKKEDEVHAMQENVRELLEKYHAQIKYHKMWQQKRLAYSISRVEHAYFMLAYFEAEPEHLESIRKELQLITDILRFVMVRHVSLDTQIKEFIEKKRTEKKVSGDEKKFPVKRTRVVVERAGVAVEERKRAFIRKAPSEAPSFEKAEAMPEPRDLEKEDRPQPHIVEAEKAEKRSEKELPQAKKASLDDLDKKLEDILGGDIDI